MSTSTTTKALIEHHVLASGPVNLRGILDYLKNQDAEYPAGGDDTISKQNLWVYRIRVQEQLNELLREGTVEMYCDGDFQNITFTARVA